MKLVYPVIFTEDPAGGYMAYVPDLEINTQGEDLAEAIAMGHDLGHTPFGHAGEDVLSQCLGKPFRHNEQSLRVVDILEKDGQGLNLTYEVRIRRSCRQRFR